MKILIENIISNTLVEYKLVGIIAVPFLNQYNMIIFNPL